MEGILKKIGITPGPWKVDDSVCFDSFISGDTGKYENVICMSPAAHTDNCEKYEPWHRNKMIISVAPEMLKTLISIGLAIEQNYAPLKIGKDNKKSVFYVIEKASGKTWEEIKELLQETEK